MLRRISEVIKDCKTFLITAHVRLDGDALGSELALCHFLKGLGKEALIYNQDNTPDNYHFLPGTDDIVHEMPDLTKYDVLFVLDCSDLERVGDQAARLGEMKKIVNIDHHVSNTGSWELAYIDREASSTGELLYRLLRFMEVSPTKEVADNLYAAIITDTGGFRYRSTGKGTLLAAADLVGAGADPQWLSENIYENNPPEKIRLLAEVLETMVFDLNGRVASLIVDLESLKAAGALTEHTEGFVDVPRTIRGVEVSILYLQLAEGKYKLSLRSKGKINIEPVARRFGGGGHMNAAACPMTGRLEDIRRQMVNALSEVL